MQADQAHEEVWPILVKTGIYDDLKGVIDIHCHPNPDFCARLLDDTDLVAIAKAVGMRGLVMKSHFSATHERAYLAEKMVGGGINVFGLLCLNPSVGGFRPETVRIAIAQGVRAIWMPSMWAENHASYVRQEGHGMGYQTIGMNFPPAGEGLTILDANGTIKDEVKDILDQVAAADLMLATGHLNVHESHILLGEAKARGITKSVVHTANYHVMKYPNEDLRQMVADNGAVLEMGFSSLPNGIWDPLDPERIMGVAEVAEKIRLVGPENVVLTSDTGQFTTAMPIEALRLWIAHMRTFGFTQGEIDHMTKHVPARLVGLDPET
ncbi:MAG: DUF6282 family protein [Pseudomonadota bacterium]